MRSAIAACMLVLSGIRGTSAVAEPLPLATMLCELTGCKPPPWAVCLTEDQDTAAFVVATVPDPLAWYGGSLFDESLPTVRAAASAEGFSFVRCALPWVGPDVAIGERAGRLAISHQPGWCIFQRWATVPQPHATLLAIALVG